MEFFESLKQGRYGSLELNRLAGRTLLKAFGFAVLIHFLAVVSPIVYSKLTGTGELPVIEEPMGPTKIVPFLPHNPGTKPATPIDVTIKRPEFVLPEPVENEPVAEDNPLPLSQTQINQRLIDLAGIQTGDLDGAQIGAIIESVPIADDPIPSPDTFTPFEVKPEMLSGCPKPEVPELAKLSKIPGKVIIKAYIDKRGRMKQFFVLSAVPKNLGFEEEVLKVLPKWKFTPAIQDRNPVGVWITIPVNFEIR